MARRSRPPRLRNRSRRTSSRRRYTPAPSNRQLRQRLRLAGSVFAIALAAATVRLVQLQVAQRHRWRERAGIQHHLPVTIPNFRRTIVDRHPVSSPDSEILAIDRPTFQLWSRPSLYVQADNQPRPQELLADVLAPIFDTPSDEVLELLEQPQSTLLRQRLSESEANRVRRAIYRAMGESGVNLSGWELTPTRERLYPQGEEAAEVVGYIQLDSERRGQAGVELASQDLLELSPEDVLSVTADGHGQPLANEMPSHALQTDEQVLQLTLDMRLQRAAREALRQGVSAFNAERGTAIALDPHTGEILAMASEPTYDPNRFYEYLIREEDYRLSRNWAVSDLYEPGSTFKPLTVALALENEAILPDTYVHDVGSLVVGGWPIHNYDYSPSVPEPGWLSISQVLQRSSNIGMIRIVDLLGRETLHSGLLDLGLNGRSGVDLPFEPNSYMKRRLQFLLSRVEAATTSFGQGIAMTPLQLAQLHSIIANGGYRVTPHIVRGLVDLDSNELDAVSRPGRERVLSPITTEIVRGMMLDVVEAGAGSPAAIPGYQIAGKTGTAQKADPEGGGYLPSSHQITSFVGYFPALNPQYVILVVVDNPQGDNVFGSTVAAPIVRAIVEEIVAGDMLRPQTQIATSE
ncbi:MAG: peptidoglycan D,D-transpeptidase FtsI family protein [Synechococcus sp.]